MLQAPKPQLELNFIEFVVLPLWRTVAQAFPTFEDRVQTMLSNHERCAVTSRFAPPLRPVAFLGTHRTPPSDAPSTPFPPLTRWGQLMKSHRAQQFAQAKPNRPQRRSSIASTSSTSAVEAQRRSSASASTSASTEHVADGTDATVAEDGTLPPDSSVPPERSPTAPEAAPTAAPAPTSPPPNTPRTRPRATSNDF